MVVRCECCVLSGRGLCDGLITRPEYFYRLWCVTECDLGTSKVRRLKLVKGCKCRIEEEEEYVISPTCFASYFGSSSGHKH
jgi:hypothetical protein